MNTSDTVYRGERQLTRSGVRAVVTADGVPFDAAHGCEWGYGGAGPARLAVLLLLHATGDCDVAARAHTWFKWAVVAGWDGARWSITAREVRAWVGRWAAEGQEWHYESRPGGLVRVAGATEGGAA